MTMKCNTILSNRISILYILNPNHHLPTHVWKVSLTRHPMTTRLALFNLLMSRMEPKLFAVMLPAAAFFSFFLFGFPLASRSLGGSIKKQRDFWRSIFSESEERLWWVTHNLTSAKKVLIEPSTTQVCCIGMVQRHSLVLVDV